MMCQVMQLPKIRKISIKQPYKYVSSSNKLIKLNNKKSLECLSQLSQNKLVKPKFISKSFIISNNIYYYKQLSRKLLKSASDSRTQLNSELDNEAQVDPNDKVPDLPIHYDDLETENDDQLEFEHQIKVRKANLKIFSVNQLKQVESEIIYQQFKHSEYISQIMQQYEYLEVDYTDCLVEVSRDIYEPLNLQQSIKQQVNYSLQNIQKLKSLRQEQIQYDWQLGPVFDKAIEFERLSISNYILFGNSQQFNHFRVFIIQKRKELKILFFQFPLHISDLVSHYTRSSELYIQLLFEKLEADSPELNRIEDQIQLERRFQEEIANMNETEQIRELAVHIAETRFY
ncbi:Hypothetical_protein [Hexamita inflata]|uniref:Hypothetical_protein n=1 Tax=Hexamita inflata TaxID=28002 RepID=A0AA86U0P0_9EUKA|nr:Hypothetical protein HINF_LOCUS23341 [Hexamita inflata]